MTSTALRFPSVRSEEGADEIASFLLFSFGKQMRCHDHKACRSLTEHIRPRFAEI
jgi:hypothetical protein